MTPTEITNDLTWKVAKAAFESFQLYTLSNPTVNWPGKVNWEDLPMTYQDAWFSSAAGVLGFLFIGKEKEG